MRTYMYLKHDHITNMYVHHLLVHEPAYFDCCINSIERCFFPTPNNTINQIRINNKRLERQRKQRKKNTHIHPHNGQHSDKHTKHGKNTHQTNVFIDISFKSTLLNLKNPTKIYSISFCSMRKKQRWP